MFHHIIRWNVGFSGRNGIQKKPQEMEISLRQNSAFLPDTGKEARRSSDLILKNAHIADIEQVQSEKKTFTLR